jgi:hypothetical protein
MHEVIPLLGDVLCALEHQCRYLRHDIVAGIASGLDEEDFVASKGKTRRERTSTGVTLVLISR